MKDVLEEEKEWEEKEKQKADRWDINTKLTLAHFRRHDAGRRRCHRPRRLTLPISGISWLQLNPLCVQVLS